MSQGCIKWRGDLGAYVIGALDREERAAMRRHLAACRACRDDYEDLLPVRDWLAWTKLHLAACPACRAGYEDLLPARYRVARLN
jgi:predicted anti-sigma-YlaC factor YlaD